MLGFAIGFAGNAAASWETGECRCAMANIVANGRISFHRGRHRGKRANIVAQGQTSWQKGQTRRSAPTHVGMATDRRGDRIGGVAGNAPTVQRTLATTQYIYGNCNRFTHAMRVGLYGWVERTGGTDDGGRDKACLVSTVDTVLIRLIRLIRSIRSVAHGCHNYGYHNGGFYDRYVRTVTVRGGVAPNAAYCAYRGEWTNAVANGMGGWGLANGRCNKKGRHAGLPLRTWVWQPTIGATALGAHHLPQIPHFA